jgi:hypothetical protein
MNESMRTIMDGLVDGLRPDLPGSVLGDVLDRLIWILADNGRSLIEVCREWLESDDLKRVEAALSITEGFLFESDSELAHHLGKVERKWPALSPRVAEILEAWREARRNE